MNNASDAQQKIDAYLERLRKNLHGLTPEEIREIVQELRTHLLEKAETNGEVSPQSVDSALLSLGSPEDLAGEYLTDNLFIHAQASRSPVRILKSLFRWASLSVAGFVVFFVCLFGYATSAVLLWCAALKPIHPATDGLWVSNGPDGLDLSFHLGFGTPSPNSREVLGWWLIPIGLLGGYALLMVTTRFALWCVGRYRQSRPLPRAGGL